MAIAVETGAMITSIVSAVPPPSSFPLPSRMIVHDRDRDQSYVDAQYVDPGPRLHVGHTTPIRVR
ncbi:hypothetical protein B1H26_03465 [Amycolatopsis sp. BJA-103]|nr:hypothetical protein BKN51_28970 [Amycolatopsis sp. BJA-103]PNE20903.1 hypothetical protein B1H26_03465 [Amycolatopsis sp. BJA-103]